MVKDASLPPREKKDAASIRHPNAARRTTSPRGQDKAPASPPSPWAPSPRSPRRLHLVAPRFAVLALGSIKSFSLPDPFHRATFRSRCQLHVLVLAVSSVSSYRISSLSLLALFPRSRCQPLSSYCPSSLSPPAPLRRAAFRHSRCQIHLLVLASSSTSPRRVSPTWRPALPCCAPIGRRRV